MVGNVFSSGYNVKLHYLGISRNEKKQRICPNFMHKSLPIMRSSFLFMILFLAVLTNGSAQQDTTSTPKDIHLLAEFTNADYNMGNVPVGKGGEFNVYIKNISTKDTLMIVDVKVSCGCTTPKYRSNDPILPGKSSYITLGFNGSGGGPFTKFADIIFQSGQSKQIKFSGVAVSEPVPAEPAKKQ
jgi:hypothetical protein